MTAQKRGDTGDEDKLSPVKSLGKIQREYLANGQKVFGVAVYRKQS